MTELSIAFHPSISDINADEWDRLVKSQKNQDIDSKQVLTYPFISHAFLSALESSKSVCNDTGWQPYHLTVRLGDESGDLIAAMPLYIKSHSYGEYVFDWSWADAYHHQGLEYFPKLLSAIPFTPSTGPRLIIAPNFDLPELYSEVFRAITDRGEQIRASSFHLLFPPKQTMEHWPDELMARRGVQYHWFNRNYTSFDDFLQTFTSRKRKNLKKERKTVLAQGIILTRKEGHELIEQDWQNFYHCYQMTYAKRSGHGGYLKKAFFTTIAKTLSDQIMMVIARQNDDVIGMALTFRDDETLYGRYWGCLAEFDCLHFEACYYQGIEYCIEKGLKRFDPGAQGEHKIQRGFEPIQTDSLHWIAHPKFVEPIRDFCQREAKHLEAYQEEAKEGLPFKKEE